MRLFRSRKKKANSDAKKRRVLFVSHEATRTGAPKIVLNVLKHFHATCDIQCETLLHSGGHLASEFEKHGLVDCMNLPRESSDELARRVTKFVQRDKSNAPVVAVCNSMESRFVSAELAKHGVPLISLLHELPSSYTHEDYATVFDSSQRIVFPVHAVREATEAFTDVPYGKGLVLSQGLLNPEFGTGISRNEAHQRIRKELGIPDNAFIVLGCGTLDLRKGIDHYVNIARATVMQNLSGTPIHFVWVGEGPRWTHSPYHYVQLDLQNSPARGYVHFIGEREDVEPYFMGSDAFLLTSRVDPFPCVIHEAMASGLPVITFSDSGGASEAVGNGSGFVVPYGDHNHAGNVIRMLAGQPEIAAGMREKSAERVRTRYRFDDYADKLIDVCESILGFELRDPSIVSKKPAIQPPAASATYPATIPMLPPSATGYQQPTAYQQPPANYATQPQQTSPTAPPAPYHPENHRRSA
jgi:glycosyltransferase involved in cell wall biosynthesis